MTIEKSDFTAAEQALIQTWIDTEIPERIQAYQDSVDNINNEQLPTLQGIEDLFEKIYASWANLHRNGFLKEIEGLGTSAGPNSFSAPITESVIQSTADNPLGSQLFPALSISSDPLFAFDLRADPGDFDVDLAAWTGTEGTGTFAVTGFDEREALVREETEWNKPAGVGPTFQDDTIIRDMWLAEEAALQTQLTALNLLDSELEVGQGGKANLAGAITNAQDALNSVQTFLANYPSMPSESARLTEIANRITQIDTRVDQIRSPGTDQDFVRGERFFWLTQRLNLSFGSLIILEGRKDTRDALLGRITDLQAELDRYADMGF